MSLTEVVDHWKDDHNAKQIRGCECSLLFPSGDLEKLQPLLGIQQPTKRVSPAAKRKDARGEFEKPVRLIRSHFPEEIFQFSRAKNFVKIITH